MLPFLNPVLPLVAALSSPSLTIFLDLSPPMTPTVYPLQSDVGSSHGFPEDLLALQSSGLFGSFLLDLLRH